MKRRNFAILTAAALSFCMLTGCGGDKEKTLDPNDIYGSWGYKFDGGSESLVIREDGTYSKVVKMSGYPDTKVDDAWSLEGSDVTIYISEYNTAFTYTVSVSEDKTIMVWDNGDNRIIYNKKQ
ncbi:MAG: hypothetical protein K5695_06570 [Oscillospiraceae bacterium]|nr:hypothetical protein [Oscillospiraceae bacterium]